MQLTTIFSSPQFSQKHQGKLKNRQHGLSKEILQPENSVLFGQKSSKGKQLVLSVLMALSFALFADAFKTQDLYKAPPIEKPISGEVVEDSYSLWNDFLATGKSKKTNKQKRKEREAAEEIKRNLPTEIF